MFEPTTAITLYTGVPLNTSNANQLWFDSLAEQEQYFAGLSSRLVNITDSQYLEKQWTIYLPYNAQDLNNVNYGRYKNKTKWFYFFVTNVEYVNPNTCVLYILLDDFQTYLFDLTFNACLVEREHVNDDSIGANLIAEPFQITDRIAVSEVDGNTYEDFYYIIDTTLDLGDTEFKTYNGGGTYGGVTHGSVWYAFENLDTINQIINDVGIAGKLDSIINIFMLPKSYVTVRSDNNRVIDSADVDMGWIDVSYPSSLNGYTPKNKKLLTYPYIEMVLTNKGNEMKSFRPERFADKSSVRFRIYRIPTITTPAICFPYNYNGIENDFKNSVTLQAFPQVSWINNPFGEWVNANTGNIVSGITTGAITGAMIGSSVAGIGTLAGAGLGALTSAISSYGQSVSAYNQPPTSEGNAGGGNAILSSARENTFRVEVRTIDKDNAKSIDDFLSRFGYKVNKIKKPNFHTRESWNYVKTVEMSIVGKCPSVSLENIKTMFDNGITLWHSKDVGNYALSNNII